jgi:xanthine dehydrogenase molybdenum-binding subunit
MADSFQPWTWEIPASDESAKREMRSRQDAYERVSGKAVFTRDVYLPGMLYAKFLTSPYAHAKIVKLDTSQAEALIGVRDIVKYDDPDVMDENDTGAQQYNILTLQRTGDFYNHPMGVVVVADSEEICDRALRLIKIEWEERPFILNMEASLKPDAPKIWTEAVRFQPTAKEPNQYITREQEVGDVRKGFAEADKILEYTIKRAPNTTAGVEATVCVAQWRGEFLDVWVHQQSIPQSNLSSTGFTRVSPGRRKANPALTHWNKITLTLPYQGAWFGGMNHLACSFLFVRLTAILARRVGKPVKLLYDESQFYLNGEEMGAIKCKVGAKKDGTITACYWHMVGSRNPVFERTYECTGIPNIRGTQETAFTNMGHIMCFRDGSSASIPHQVMFDRVAAEFSLDPTEVALKNDGCRGHYWDWVTQYQKDNGFPQRWSLKEVIEKGKKAFDWDRKWHAPGTKRLANGRMHGMGFMSINQWTNTSGSTLASLMLHSGKVAIVGLRCNPGSDSESGFRQCVAAAMGLKYEDTVIHQHRSDNGMYRFAVPGGSMGTVMTVPQLIIAARELKQRILQAAITPRPGGMMFPAQPASFPGKKPEDLDIKDSMVFERANPGNRKPVVEVLGSSSESDNSGIAHPVAGAVSGLTSDGKPDQTYYFMARQAHFIEVEVDTETGQVEITNTVCVNDVGHCFNPEGAMGQQYGGAIMAFGRSATEEKIFCPTSGVGLNYDHMFYHIGTMNDYAPVQCILNESHLGYSAYGAYGIGENVGASLSAITSSAIYNAIGKWVLDYPTTPDKVLKALGKI